MLFPTQQVSNTISIPQILLETIHSNLTILTKHTHGPQPLLEQTPPTQTTLLLGATKTISLTVQQDPIPAPVTAIRFQLSTGLDQLKDKTPIGTPSHQTGSAHLMFWAQTQPIGRPGAVQPDGSAPNSAHIMWSKPIQYGGIVGGNHTTIAGEMYYTGLSYNSRYNNPLIMQGTLFYQEPNS